METIEMIKEKFGESSRIEYELYNMCVNYIKERLSSLPDNEICFDPDTSLRIRYYGYGTITYSLVNRVYLIDGDIYADTEDIEGYEITDAEVIDLYNISREISYILID